MCKSVILISILIIAVSLYTLNNRYIYEYFKTYGSTGVAPSGPHIEFTNPLFMVSNNMPVRKK